MFKFNKEKNEYRSSFNNPLILFFTAFGSFIFISGLSAYLESPPELVSPGTAFMLLWSSFALFMIYSTLNMFFRCILINENGVTLKNIIGSKKLSWEEIKEYGIVYNGTQRDGEAYFNLYFSTEKSVPLSNSKRRFQGKTIKFQVLQKDLGEVSFSVLPFCKEFLHFEAN